LFPLLGVYRLSCYDVLEADTMNSMSNVRRRKSADEAPHVAAGSPAPKPRHGEPEEA
jgi:hypothetical protein